EAYPRYGEPRDGRAAALYGRAAQARAAAETAARLDVRARNRKVSSTAAQARPAMRPNHMPRGPMSRPNAQTSPMTNPTTQYESSVMSMGILVSFSPRSAPTAAT